MLRLFIGSLELIQLPELRTYGVFALRMIFDQPVQYTGCGVRFIEFQQLAVRPVECIGGTFARVAVGKLQK